MRKLNIKKAMPLVQMAIEEDFGDGDITSRLCAAAQQQVKAKIIAREDLIVCGMALAKAVFALYDKTIKFDIKKTDGTKAAKGDILATVRGSDTSILNAERVVLNFLQRTSGIATLTSRYVQQTKGTKAKIYDTRKTLPGWRELDKYAVRCGKGHNHRYNLADAVLIKDNHIAAMGRNWKSKIAKAAQKAKTEKIKFFCVEVDNLKQLKAVLPIPGVDIILLDNFSIEQMEKAVAVRNLLNKKVKLEASGGVVLDTVAQIAKTGIDRIAVGAITHSAAAADIAIDF